MAQNQLTATITIIFKHLTIIIFIPRGSRLTADVFLNGVEHAQSVDWILDVQLLQQLVVQLRHHRQVHAGPQQLVRVLT